MQLKRTKKLIEGASFINILSFATPYYPFLIKHIILKKKNLSAALKWVKILCMQAKQIDRIIFKKNIYIFRLFLLHFIFIKYQTDQGSTKTKQETLMPLQHILNILSYE